jgi:hypothetical protein
LLSTNDKYLPLKWMGPLVFELELADPVAATRTGSTGGTPDYTFHSNYSISDVMIKADTVTLDSELESSFASTLLAGRALSLSLSTYAVTAHGVMPGSDDPMISSQRAVSRLKSVFVSMFSTRTDTKSEVNMFAHPNGNATGASNHVTTQGNYDAQPDSDDVEYQFSINSEQFPVMPCRSRAESLSQLYKAIGIHGSTTHSIGITDASYQSDQYLIALDTELSIGSSLSGKNLRVGPSQLTIQLKNLTKGGTIAAGSANAITKIFFALQYDVVLEIRDSGITILS